MLVSQHVDSIIYLVKSDSTHIKTIKTGINRLLEVGANISGVVVNQVDLKMAATYGEYTGYYDQYGYQTNDVSNMIKQSLSQPHD